MYNVILVDDEPRSIDALEANIEWRKCGIRDVHKAMNMESAISIIKKHKIDILICDIEMPNGSGLHLLEWLREHKYEINCIFVTCHPEFDYMRKAIQLKCYDYILKPIDYSEFSVVLTKLVKKMEASSIEGVDTEAVNWGGLTDYQIREKENSFSEQDVERRVKKYIREHMMDSINIPDIAKELNFNPQYLMRAFKNKTGFSIGDYITKARMETARQILKDTKIPIKDVANMIGYADYAYFTRVFKKEYETSPSEYRNRQNKQDNGE
ncbi:response regulator transcription factor [Anaerobium acetethylicum]|uniref:Stage 0 sporulation protein A homolog n=1 Tax=Anaerobium acetethylicum TaxID=1619234 RepID=A0A1D3TTW0_9FIRM|nr:response regulator [Anaerobium acetethylicum]SCP97400.1 two-component system, response regulator YesN [Anaerobium acetethylicum]